jgi:hypothetical protein
MLTSIHYNPRSGRRAFTLFEVAISLLILSAAVLSLLLVFPVGIKAQQNARFQIYANSKVLEMITTFSNPSHLWWDVEEEAEKPGQCMLQNMIAVDFDRQMTAADIGLLPLPNDIARRIDSADDEITRIIDNGGRLYYIRAAAYETGFDNRGQDWWGSGTPLEAQSLLFGVVGHAQQNALPSHPCIAWPYYDFWPAPPQPWEYESWQLNGWPGLAQLEALIPIMNGNLFNASALNGNPAGADLCISRAVTLAQAVFTAAELDTTTARGVTTVTIKAPLPLPPPSWSTTDQNVFPKPWKVLAARYLAVAATMRTSSLNLPTVEQQNYAKACHESSLAWVMRYVSTNPYDWGCPRPFNRSTCFDFPLLQYDLFPASSDPYKVIELNNFNGGGDGTNDKSYRIATGLPRGQRPANYGQACGTYSWNLPRWALSLSGTIGLQMGGLPQNKAAVDNSWGDNDHFNLLKKFDAAERCRQIVCWAADWKSYEDFEIAVSGPYSPAVSFYDSRGAVVTAERSLKPPDYYLSWSTVTRNVRVPSGTYGGYRSSPDFFTSTQAFKEGWLGLYGADRNANGVLDRGPLPTSTRIRATLMGRYNFYDRRMIGSLRN